MLFFLTACGRYTESNIIKDLEKKINKLETYKLFGKLEIVNNDNVYNYDVEVSHKKDQFYRIVVTNISNNFTQVILKNEEGVYILTPALNKSFKFQSDWPYSNSQIYLLEALLGDIKNSENRKFSEQNNGYVFSTSVNYPNNKKLVSQKIYLDKDLNVKEVNVYDENDISYMKMKFETIDYSPTFKDDYFNLDTIMSTYAISLEKEDNVLTLDDLIYPLVIPDGTKLVNEDRVKKNLGERVIMTFDGEKPFVLVEETVNYSDNPEIIPTYGDVELIGSSLAVINDNSANWFDNGIEYYVVSDVMDTDELLQVVRSISVLPVSK